MPGLETSLTYCTYCPKLCRHTCPVSNATARETLTPQTKMATMRLLRIGRGFGFGRNGRERGVHAAAGRDRGLQLPAGNRNHRD